MLKYFQYSFEFKCLYLFIPCFGRTKKMAFYSFTDGACCHTLNISSATCVLYSPAYDLVNLGVVCIGPATNNIAEYGAVIGLLTEATSQDVHNLVVLMDSPTSGLSSKPCIHH